MRAALLVVGLLLAAGAVSWLLLRPPQAPRDDIPSDGRPASPAGAPPGPPVATAEPTVVPGSPPPEESVPEDPEWHTQPLPLPKGRGPLRGSELVDAVEAAGKVRFRGATEADLQALRATVFEHADRDQEHPHAAMMGWLKEAGFDVEVHYPTLIVRRLPDR